MNEYAKTNPKSAQPLPSPSAPIRARFGAAWLGLFALAPCGCSSAQEPYAPSQAFQHDLVLTMSLEVPAGAELHQCQFATLPNTTAVEAVAFSHRYTVGSHHFVVIATDLDTIPEGMQGQYDCTTGKEAIMQHARGVLYGGQTPLGQFPLPSGVGFRFGPKQVVIMQTHYLNASDTPLAAKVEFGIDVGAPESIHQEAGYMFFYDPFVYVPAHGNGSTGLSCQVSKDISIISASSHYHQRGTGMKVWNDAGGTPANAPFYETNDWEHPVDFRGPLAVASGTSLRFQCDYMNNESTDVFEGPNAKTSEMCVLGGLYYPKQDPVFENCSDPKFLGAGTKTCSDLVACVRQCPTQEGVTDPCWQKCIASGCGGAADALLPAVACAKQQCETECATGMCEECAIAKCPEYGACTAQSCSAK